MYRWLNVINTRARANTHTHTHPRKPHAAVFHEGPLNRVSAEGKGTLRTKCLLGTNSRFFQGRLVQTRGSFREEPSFDGKGRILHHLNSSTNMDLNNGALILVGGYPRLVLLS